MIQDEHNKKWNRVEKENKIQNYSWRFSNLSSAIEEGRVYGVSPLS